MLQRPKIFLFSCFIIYFLCSFSNAQTFEKEVLIKKWDLLADRAEEVITEDAASSESLRFILSDLLAQRKEVLSESMSDGAEIAKLSSELEALGPEPESGEIEASNISERRKSLQVRLENLNVPLAVTSSILKRTDFLIAEINEMLRQRLTQKLFTLGPTPLNFDLWPNAISDIKNLTRKIKSEFNDLFSSDIKRVLILQKLPLISVLILIGTFLFTIFYRRLFRKLIFIFSDPASKKIDGWVFVFLSVARLAVLVLAAFSFIEAIKLTGVFGLFGAVILETLPIIALSMIGAKWTAENLFSEQFSAGTNINLNLNYEKLASKFFVTLGFLFGLSILLDKLATQDSWSYASQAVLNFPIILASGFFMFRLATLFEPIAGSFSKNQAAEENSFSIINALIKIGKIVAVAGPLLAAVGYLYAAQRLMYPTMLSLFIFSASYIAFLFLKEIIFNFVEESVEEQDVNSGGRALLPVLIALVIFLIDLPILGLVGGATTADIYAIWLKLNEGVPLGAARLTLPGILSFLIIFFIGYTLTRLVQRIMKNNILPKTRLDSGGRNALLSGFGYTGIILSAMIAVSSTGLDLSSLAIVAGALSVGLGFGLQTIVSNFVSGIILLIERPIKEGDWIEVASFSGTVRKISVRSTQIETFDRGTVIVPNSELIAGSVLNYTHSNAMGRVRVPIGVAYGTDVRKVEKILLEIAETHPHTLSDPKPSVVFMGFGADSLNFEIRAFMKDVGYVLAIKSDLNFEIVQAFEKENIEIPFSQREIRIKNISELKN